MAEDPEQLEALLADYVEGDIDAEGARIVEAHLAANPSGRELVERMRADRAAIRAMPKLTAPTDLSEDLRGQLERDLLFNYQPVSTPRTRRFSPPRLAMAAMVMVGLGLAGGTYVLLSNRPARFDVALRDPQADPTTAVGGVAPIESLPAAPTTLARRGDPAAPNDFFDRQRTTSPAERIMTAAAATEEKTELTLEAPPLASAAPRVGGNGPASIDAAAPTARGDIAGADVAGALKALPAAAPTLDIVSSAPPADVIAALSTRALDVRRRSVVIVVEQRDALDALATVSRSARMNNASIEVSDRAAQAAFRQADLSQVRQQAKEKSSLAADAMDAEPNAEFAVVARALQATEAATMLDDLKRVDPALAVPAYELDPDLIPQQLPADPAKLFDAAATMPAAVAVPATLPATTRAVSNLISQGERLRVTLVDPDAFDLRTQHEVTVDPRGHIALPSLEGVPAAGLSVDALRRSIVEAYRSANLMRRPIVRVESLDKGTASKEAADPSRLVDLYVVVRRPITPPAATQPTSAPTTSSATSPTQ